jgi:hypothetical protein
VSVENGREIGHYFLFQEAKAIGPQVFLCQNGRKDTMASEEGKFRIAPVRFFWARFLNHPIPIIIGTFP